MSTKAFSSLRIKAGEMDDTFLNNPKSVAGQFSSSTAYAAGDYVYYNNKLYRFTAAHAAGAWSGSDAEEITVSGELTAIKADLTDLTEELGFYQEVTFSIPEGYKTANYENSNHTTGYKYADGILEIYKVISAGSVSNGNLRYTDSHVGITLGDSISFNLTNKENPVLKYITSINANAEKFNLEIRFYNSDYSAMASGDSYVIEFEQGSNKEELLHINQFVSTNNINTTTYPNLVILGLKWFSHTASESETAILKIIGVGEDNAVTIVDRVEVLENGKVPFSKLDDDVVEYLEFPDNKSISFTLEDTLVWYETGSGHQGGATASFSGADATDLIDVDGIDYFNYKFYSVGEVGASIAYYNESEEYISGINYDDFGNPFYEVKLETSSFPVGTKYVRFCMKIRSTGQTPVLEKITGEFTLHTAKNKNENLDERVTVLENNNDPPKEIYWAVCGDSITNANHESIYIIPQDDLYYPIDGYSDVNYNRKNYAYYFAREHGMKWANYGYGGTTLHHCDPKGITSAHPYPFVDDRIENLKAGISWDYITLFFGWNDVSYGPIYQRDLWLSETYGADIGYPVKEEQIGTTGFATQAQKDACDAVTGSVGGVQYNDNDAYFFAKFVGTINDSVKTTWMGAWNYALDYLMRKYPTAKIMIVAPFISSITNSTIIRQSVKDIAEKWGVSYFDFEDLPYWYYKINRVTTPFAPASGNWEDGKGHTCPNTVEGYNRARLSHDSTHPSNLGYKILANPFGMKLLGS